MALVLALSNLGRYEEAMQAFKHAKELDPEVSETQVLSGKAYLEAGRCQEAIACFRDVILIDQGHARAHYNLGRAYLAVGDVDLALTEQRLLEDLDADLAGRLREMIPR
jgi:tetratricopeptide (TPR) repeat protein